MSTATLANRKAEYEQLGFWIERGLLPGAEIDRINARFMTLHAAGGVKGFYEPQPEGSNDGWSHPVAKGDPLAKYPRVMHPHRFMPMAMDYLLDARIENVLEDLLGGP